jgi:hypothetical protein
LLRDLKAKDKQTAEGSSWECKGEWKVKGKKTLTYRELKKVDEQPME